MSLSRFAWTVPTMVPLGNSRGKSQRPGLGGSGGGRGGGCASTRLYRPRVPTSNEFSRAWQTIGHISPSDKITALGRCDCKYTLDALLRYSHDDDAMDGLVFIATGWQPGHDLFERDREKIWQFVAKQHAERGYPLRDMTPEQALEKVASMFGKAPVLTYVIDKDNAGQQFISNGLHSNLLPAPSAGRVWDIYAPQHGQDASFTIVSDGIQHYYAHSFFPESDSAPTAQHPLAAAQHPLAPGGLQAQPALEPAGQACGVNSVIVPTPIPPGLIQWVI